MRVEALDGFCLGRVPVVIFVKNEEKSGQKTGVG